MQTLWDHLAATLELTGLQILVWVVPLVILGCLMQMVAGWVESAARRLLGRGAAVFFWPGVVVHELSHAVMCLVFFHRITGIRFFAADPMAAHAGYVAHTYRPTSLYQRIGRFFIGTAPLISGALIISGATVWLMPEVAAVGFGIGPPVVMGPTFFLGHLGRTLSACIAANHLFRWEFWAFLVILVCTGSSMRLSRSDLRSAVFGFGCLAGFVFLVNLALYWAYPMAGMVSLLRVAAGASRFFVVYNLVLLALVVNVAILFLLVLMIRARAMLIAR